MTKKKMTMDITYGVGAMSREFNLEPDVKNRYIPEHPEQGGFDFTKIPFPDATFDLILFDPPHKFMRPSLRKKGGVWGAFIETYGSFDSYKLMISQMREAFLEIERVLKVGGICVFKWCDTDCAHARIVKEIPPSFAVDFKRRPSSKQKKSLTLFWYLTKEW